MSDKLHFHPQRPVHDCAEACGQWEIEGVDFLGDNVNLTLTDPRDGPHLCALDHGHFGVKLHRSSANAGRRSAPHIRPNPKAMRSRTCGAVRSIGARRASGRWRRRRRRAWVIWCGTLPGGLFRSTDHGQSWQMLRALWEHPKRKQWMGGGADLPGIHSICVDPRDSSRV